MAQTNTSFTRRTGAPDDAKERSVSELLQQLTEQTTRLAQKEIELAKAEMAVKGKRLGIGAGAFSAAGLISLLALGAATAGAILGLATALEGWLAALIVAVAYLALAGVLALVGRSKVQAATPPVPEQTVESIKEDVESTKEKAKEGRE
ncbi:MAG TPA: phage holin family protein [Solirubrobacterales bacterium]|nr:phage holin family protein [Solirubrobacterales bacterium]